MELPKELQEIKKRSWFKHASRWLSFNFTCIHLAGYVTEYPKVLGIRFKFVAVESKIVSDWNMFRNKEDLYQLNQIVKKRIESEKFVENAISQIYRVRKGYFVVADVLKKINFKKQNNQQLRCSYSKYVNATTNYVPAFSAFIQITDVLMQKLEHELKSKIKSNKEQEKLIYLLGTPSEMTISIKEEIDFLRMLEKIKNNKKILSNGSLVKKHFDRYQHIGAYVEANGWNWREYLLRIKKELKQVNFQARIQELISRRKIAEVKILEVIGKYQLNPKLIEMIRQTILIRINAESDYGYMNLATKPLFTEIAKRKKLSVTKLKYLSPKEISNLLIGKEFNYQKLINQRSKHYCIITSKKEIIIFQGKDVDKLLSILDQEDSKCKKSDEKIIKGSVASQGLVKGRVKIILEIKDINKVKEGDILVAPNTMPMYVPAMKHSAAIVTDEGGLTCHAAIVSRELGKPCIIGTKIATKVLKDDDLVEVDANRGIVRKL